MAVSAAARDRKSSSHEPGYGASDYPRVDLACREKRLQRADFPRSAPIARARARFGTLERCSAQVRPSTAVWFASQLELWFKPYELKVVGAGGSSSQGAVGAARGPSSGRASLVLGLLELGLL